LVLLFCHFEISRRLSVMSAGSSNLAAYADFTAAAAAAQGGGPFAAGYRTGARRLCLQLSAP
jgi:hypothetical protein